MLFFETFLTHTHLLFFSFLFFSFLFFSFLTTNTSHTQWNTFTQACLDVMGEMSVAAHKDGFLVTLVPPESYLDASTSDYDRSLTHSYPEPWHPEFKYHGHNVYAYLLAKYKLATFDLIDIQLYESYSHATYFIDQLGIAPAGGFLNDLFWLSLP